MDVAERRVPLNRDRVLDAAVDLADRTGLEALSMRNLAHELGVVPMALYKHVANKDELLDGMLDRVIAWITPARDTTARAPGSRTPDAPGLDWKIAVRERILGARQALLLHPWAWRLIDSRTDPTPAMLAYLDSVVGIFLTGGFSVDQTHHIVHALGTRMLGYTQDLFVDSQPTPPEVQKAMARAMADSYPNLATIAMAAAHDESSIVGAGCDDQFEFEFTLDLLLDGFERLPR
ncbi:TetR/AcrR family transcriptional regulator C-terminal domain-containing protein [Actinoplanes sp. L3-i22]|uniref:TetR/AcrR family transcriptional regulator C-terminal domain-containing protein n=1 Tax=Actinoplanes sp. L3-i22 TaxID=2836373 RepID=UPI001C741D94|nr:TetR/AcrR family transcriptional regulator C-terminal domain-containing protein [Actinoplanes sp. L3-i22]BCY06928.1 TetR family transcriptional regulator [Actinoplanes sp. L3-i22]